jgi:hypothetical protein
MRDFIDLCWYVPWLRVVCEARLAGSASNSLLLVAQHDSGNHVPIIRSGRLRDVLDLRWYVTWLRDFCQAGGSQCVHSSSTSCSTCFGQTCAHHQELTTA